MNYYLSLIARKAKTVNHLLASEDLKTINIGFRRNLHIIGNMIKAIPYFIFADLEDRRYGGKCTNRTIASKYSDEGAHDLQNSDYRCIEQLFEAVPCGQTTCLLMLAAERGECLLTMIVMVFLDA